MYLYVVKRGEIKKERKRLKSNDSFNVIISDNDTFILSFVYGE